jgi:hypothetical protein
LLVMYIGRIATGLDGFRQTKRQPYFQVRLD